MNSKLFLGVFIGLMLIPGVMGQEWYDFNWLNRQQITIVNNNNSAVLIPNYTVKIWINASEMTLQNNCEDIRIVDSETQTEIDWYNDTVCNSTIESIPIEFVTIRNISAGATNTNYFIYYNNPTATAWSVNRSKVYLGGDPRFDSADGWQEVDTPTNYLDIHDGELFIDQLVRSDVSVYRDFSPEFDNVQYYISNYTLNISSALAPSLNALGSWTTIGDSNKFSTLTDYAGLQIHLQDTPDKAFFLSRDEIGTGTASEFLYPPFIFYVTQVYNNSNGNITTTFYNDVERTDLNLSIGHITTSTLKGNHVLPIYSLTVDASPHKFNGSVDDFYIYPFLSPVPTITSGVEETVYGLANCEANGTVVALNFTVFDEENKTDTILTNFELLINSSSIEDVGNPIELNLTKENSTFLEVCIVQNSSVNVDIFLRYTNHVDDPTNYSTRHYHTQNFPLDNTTDTVILYSLEDDLSNAITFTIKDRFGDTSSDVIIKATRFFIGEGKYVQVATALSDFSGQAVMPLKLNEWYIFIAEQNNSVLRIFEQKLLSTTDDIELQTEIGADIGYLDYFDTVAYTCTNNNVTEEITCIYTDVSGKSLTMELTLEERTLTRQFTTICTDSLTASSGTLTCSYAGYNNTVLTYNLKGTFCCSEATTYVFEVGNIELIRVGTYGLAGIIALALLLMAGQLFGIFHPVVPIITSVLVIWLGLMMGVLIIAPIAVMSLLLAGGLLINKMR